MENLMKTEQLHTLLEALADNAMTLGNVRFAHLCTSARLGDDQALRCLTPAIKAKWVEVCAADCVMDAIAATEIPEIKVREATDTSHLYAPRGALSSSEISRLLYLADALESSPKQCKKLLDIMRALDGTESLRFRWELARLRAASDDPVSVLAAVADLKKRI